jgi:plasmid stabilization system protein ParE
MIFRYTDAAASELEAILSYVSRRNPSAAARIAARVQRTIDALVQFPEMAQLTDDPGIRRMPVGRYPYLIFYTVESGELVILHIRHTSRRALRSDGL